MLTTATRWGWKISTLGGGQVSLCLTSHYAKGGDPEVDQLIIGGSFDGPTHSLTQRYDSSEDGCGRGTPLVPIAFSAKDHGADATEELSPTLRAGGAVAVRTAQTSGNGHGVAENVAHTLDGAQGQAVACFKGGQGAKAGGIGYSEDAAPTLPSADSGSNRTPTLMQGMAVRRLTPRECERLQGFPDDYTKISENTADGPRYKALGNSMAVPVMHWIGTRIQAVDELCEARGIAL